VAVHFLSLELGFHSSILLPLAALVCNDSCHGGCFGVKVDGSRTTVGFSTGMGRAEGVAASEVDSRFGCRW